MSSKNSIHSARQANVSITVARVYDPALPVPWEKQNTTLNAIDYDAEKHGHLEFYCPDCAKKGKQVRLKRPEESRYKDIPFMVLGGDGEPLRDSVTNTVIYEYLRYKFPARYTSWPGKADQHACDLEKHRQRDHDFIQRMRARGGFDLEGTRAAFRYTAGIPCGQITHQSSRGLSQHFQHKGTTPKAIPTSQETVKPKRSQRVATIKDLASLIEDSYFEPEEHQRILWSANGRLMTLSDLYQEDPVVLFKALRAQQKSFFEGEALENRTATAFLFRPIPRVDFWEYDRGIFYIYGQTKSATGKNGQDYNLGLCLKITDGNIYHDIRKAVVSQGKREFLIYAEDAHLDWNLYSDTLQKIRIGQRKSRGLYAYLPVHTSEQLMAWSPPKAQAEMDLQPRIPDPESDNNLT